MPRRTPVRELQKEEAIPSSPLRRSSRISNSSPVPTKVVSRRNSATETPTPKTTRSRRLSQDQELEAEVDADKKAPVKTPRTRRASLNANNEESAKLEEETATKGKTPDSKKPVTRRRRSTSQDPEPVEEPVRKTRSRNTSAGPSDRSVEDTTKPSENGHSEVDEEVDQVEVVESKSTTKKKKLDVLKVDLDLSVIKETSFVEDEDKETEQEQDQEKKSEQISTVEATVDVEDMKETTTEETVQAVKEVTTTKTTEDSIDSVVEKPLEEKIYTEEEKSSTETKTSENSEDVDDTKKEEAIAEEISSSKVEDATDKTLTEEKKLEPVIEETEDTKEVETTKQQTSEKAATSTKEDDRIEEKSDSPSILKENSSIKEADASFSDSSFQLQLSTSVMDDVNKTDGNISPTSNKENVQPQQKSEESVLEPMDVDESFSDLPSPTKTNRKSLNASKMKLDDVEKKLEIADEIAQFLTEGITRTSELLANKKPDVPKIVLTISETTEDKETTVDMSTVEYEKPIKEVTDIHLKQSEVTPQIEESAKEESVEKEASVVMPADDCKEEAIEESAKLNKTQENLLSEESKPDDVATQQKEDAEISLRNEEKSQVADEDLSVSLNDADTSIKKTTETSFEKTIERSTLEKSSVEAEDCKQENSVVESTADEEEATETPAISTTTEEVTQGNAIQKEETENVAVPTETLSCSLRDDSATTEVQETSVEAKDISFGDMKPHEEISDVAESQTNDVEKKEMEESEEEIVIDVEGDMDGCEEKEDNDYVDQEEGIKEITVSSPVLNKSEVEDHGNSSCVNKTVHRETPSVCSSTREIVIVSDDENSPEDKVEERNQVAPASDEEVEFVREDFEPTVVKTSPRNENELNIQETLSVEKANSLNSSKSWVDKTTFVMQETIRAEEDKETSLRDRIHKVVDLFCSEIKNKGDISINVSLECTGQNSDVSDHETSIKHNVEAEPSGAEERELANKGSKRRKLYHPENYTALSMLTENTPENTTQQSLQKKKKKKRKLHKKTSEEAQAEEENEKQVAKTSKEQETSPKKKIRKQKSSSSMEEVPSPKKKNKKQKSTIVAESHAEAVSPTKKVKKLREDAVQGEEIEDNQDKKNNRVSKKSKRHLDQEILEETRDIIPNKNENVVFEEEAYSSPFARYFSSSFDIDESEDENDVTYQPSRDLNSSDSDLITDESRCTEYSSSEEVEETEESFLFHQKNKTGKTAESQRLSYSSDDNEEEIGSGSEDVFMSDEAAEEEDTKQDTKKSENKNQKTSKQKKKSGQSDVSDEGMLQSSLKKGKKSKTTY